MLPPLSVDNSEQFFKLEESIEQVQRQIAKLQTQIAEYEYKTVENIYTVKLKELIDCPPPLHKIILNNGSIIRGTIERDRL